MWSRAGVAGARAARRAAVACVAPLHPSALPVALAARSCAPSASASACIRGLHASASAVRAPVSGGTPTGAGEDDFPDNFLDDVDGMFSDEVAHETGSAANASRGALSDLLQSTRQAQAAADARAAGAPTDSLDAQKYPHRKFLNRANPPRLETKHYDTLRHAQAQLRAKLTRMQREARDAAIARKQPMAEAMQALADSPAYRTVAEDETEVSDLCRQLFPPEQVVDDAKVGELLDYAESMPGVMHLVQPDAVDPLKLMSLDQRTTRANRHLFCLFCKPSTAILPRNQLTYTNLNLLTQFVNERGMIIQRDESRLCMKHQRQMARTIKQARSIGLLSPMSNWRVPYEFVSGSQSTDSPKLNMRVEAANLHAAGATHLRTAERVEEDVGITGEDDDFTQAHRPTSRK